MYVCMYAMHVRAQVGKYVCMHACDHGTCTWFQFLLKVATRSAARNHIDRNYMYLYRDNM